MHDDKKADVEEKRKAVQRLLVEKCPTCNKKRYSKREVMKILGITSYSHLSMYTQPEKYAAYKKEWSQRPKIAKRLKAKRKKYYKLTKKTN